MRPDDLLGGFVGDEAGTALSSVMLGLDPLLSGLNLVDMAHGVDSTCVRAFGDDLGHERG
ncbi:hypothetical protein SAMN05880593_121127, partial [Rhizobium sp. RU36D]